MPLESGEYISDLDQNFPTGPDGLVQGDDHMRLIKKVLKQTFRGGAGQGLSSAINATEAQFNHLVGVTSSIQGQFNAINALISGVGSVPIGGIINYNGLIAEIPANYNLCDGTNGTPNMVESFVYGTALDLEMNTTGGSADAVLPAHAHTANHAHAGSMTTDGDHVHDLSVSVGGGGLTRVQPATGAESPISGAVVSSGMHTHTLTVENEDVTTSTSGVLGTGANIPPWVKLAFIRRMS